MRTLFDSVKIEVSTEILIDILACMGNRSLNRWNLPQSGWPALCEYLTGFGSPRSGVDPLNSYYDFKVAHCWATGRQPSGALSASMVWVLNEGSSLTNLICWEDQTKIGNGWATYWKALNGYLMTPHFRIRR